MLFEDIYFSVLDKTWFKVYKMVDPTKLSELLITAVDSTVRKLQLIQISTNERFIRKKQIFKLFCANKER